MYNEYAGYVGYVGHAEGARQYDNAPAETYACNAGKQFFFFLEASAQLDGQRARNTCESGEE